MIKRKPSNHNLKSKQFQFIDTNPVSKDFFRVDLPEKFYIGKNSFTIKPTDNLLKNSQIQIDILDTNGNNLYFEITDIINENNARLIVLYLYPDMPFGEIQFLIAGTTKLNSSVLWKSEKYFSYQPTTERPIFKDSPRVKIQEKLFPLKEQTIARSTSKVRTTQFLNILNNSESTTPLFKLSDKYVEPLSINYLGTSTPTGSLDSDLFIVETRPFAANRPIIPVNTLNYDTVQTNESFFSSSMVGGILEFNLYQYVRNKYDGLVDILPPDLLNKLQYNVYTSSIVKIIDDTRANIYPNFKYQLDSYLTLTDLTNFSNFTCSYLDSGVVGTNTHPSDFQSFLYTEISNLEPVAGNVEYIDVLYKPYNFIGEYLTLNSIEVKPKDLLINTGDFQVIENDLQFRRYGMPNFPMAVSSSWTSSIVGNGITGSSFDFRDGTSNTGIIHLNHTKIHNNESYIKLYTTASYDFINSKNGAYTLSFDYEYISNADITKPKLEILISGSVSENNGIIGFINGGNGNKRFDFLTGQTTLNKIYFNIYGGDWKLRNIKLEATTTSGFNAGHIYFLTPISFLFGKNNQQHPEELKFKFKYRNGINYSNLETNINGFIFSGSR
jgi:hypothetical protein